MEGKYGYCTDFCGIFSGEFDTREKALDAARHDRSAGGRFETGRYRRVMFTIDVNDIIESLNEYACNEAGEVAEDFLHYVPKTQRDELGEALNSALNVWMMKHEHDQIIYSVVDVQEHKVK